MQVKTSTVVRVVLIALYLSTESLCHYIPENKMQESNKKNETNSQRDKIQICGNALTTMIVEACDGIVGSPDLGHLSRGSVQARITEDCCDRECPLDYLQNFCGHTPLFTSKKTVRGKLLSKLNSRNRIAKGENQNDGGKNEKKNSQIEVRTNQIDYREDIGNNILESSSYERFNELKNAIFGYRLINQNWSHRKQNKINRTWPSLQIGTISPEIDKFGGQPIIMIKKNKHSS